MASSFGFELRSLEVFVQIVETGSMTLAGQRMGMSQSSISQVLASLEGSLHTELIDRSVRPMEVTSAGRFFYDRAVSLLQEAQITSQEMRRADYKQLRHVRIALVDSIVTAVGKPLIEVVKRRTQNWSVITGNSHLHDHSLLSRQVDIVITDDLLDGYEGLSRYPILKEPFVIAVPVDYQGDGDLNSLSEELGFIRYSAASLIGQDIERYLRRNSVDLPMRLQLDNSFAVVSAVSAGIGFTITTPLCLFQSGIRQHNVKLLPLPSHFAREITLMARDNELGDLPATISRDCRQILNDSFYREVVAAYRWLAPEITLSS